VSKSIKQRGDQMKTRASDTQQRLRALRQTQSATATLHCNARHNTAHTELHTAQHTALHCAALRCTALHCTALHCTALHTTQHNTTQHNTKKHCTALHCTAHCTRKHCTVHCTSRCAHSPARNPSVVLEFFLLRVLSVITFLSLVSSSTSNNTMAPGT
jgi:hypothetical protein